MRRFEASGMSVTRFCQREQISVQSFYHWRKRLSSLPTNGPSPSFVPVRLTQAAAVEIHLPSGARVCVPVGDAESLRVAIAAAGRWSSDPDAEADAC